MLINNKIILVINEIKERQEFLNEMTKLGQGKKYKNKIQFEINEVIIKEYYYTI